MFLYSYIPLLDCTIQFSTRSYKVNKLFFFLVKLFEAEILITWHWRTRWFTLYVSQPIGKSIKWGFQFQFPAVDGCQHREHYWVTTNKQNNTLWARKFKKKSSPKNSWNEITIPRNFFFFWIFSMKIFEILIFMENIQY